ncbi:hypothetical protein VNO80_02437 [Phaseolus coccineus]|uniref:Uncharacterized protein n=1 Tax=Phaseolus coccineus TaxID=3886 RepID=A0AAN9NU60_PHACN
MERRIALLHTSFFAFGRLQNVCKDLWELEALQLVSTTEDKHLNWDAHFTYLNVKSVVLITHNVKYVTKKTLVGNATFDKDVVQLVKEVDKGTMVKGFCFRGEV